MIDHPLIVSPVGYDDEVGEYYLDEDEILGLDDELTVVMTLWQLRKTVADLVFCYAELLEYIPEGIVIDQGYLDRLSMVLHDAEQAKILVEKIIDA